MEPVRAARNVVTVRVPRTMTLDQAQTVLKNTFRNIGCVNCFSGHDIRFESVFEYTVDPATLELREGY